jgi:DNA-binding transcriptional regulator YdaS (Cro superfamily)
MSLRPKNKEVERAIKAAGGVSALAAALGVSKQVVHQWWRVPAERVQAVVTVTGIPPWELRPDIFRKGQK